MKTLTEKAVVGLRDEVLYGRLEMSNAVIFSIVSLFFSGLAVGMGFVVANANTVGWETLSTFYHILFYIEAVSFVILILALLFCWRETALNQKILSIVVVVCSYKMALDPYLYMLMLSKDSGVYESFLPLVLVILMVALILHIFFLKKWIQILKREKKAKKSNVKTKVIATILLICVLIMGVILKNGLLDEPELLYGLAIMTVICISLSYAACEFIIACYCIFRFPSFSVDPARHKNAQIVKATHQKKKKKKKKITNKKRW